MSERMSAIEGYSNYFITDKGKVINSRGKEKTLRESTDGYQIVDLYRDGIRTTHRVHRLVSEAFVPNPNNKPDVNHRDGNKFNNSFDNLEWVTKSENMIHAYELGLNKHHATYGMLGHKNPNGGRKGNKVKIVETGEIFKNYVECANSIGGNDRRICDCINGKQHTHCGYHFERV